MPTVGVGGGGEMTPNVTWALKSAEKLKRIIWILVDFGDPKIDRNPLYYAILSLTVSGFANFEFILLPFPKQKCYVNLTEKCQDIHHHICQSN